MSDKAGDPKIRKPRSLGAKGYAGWKDNSAQKKHFKLNGAVPTNAPSTGVKHGGKRKICNRSPDHEHHYEVKCERAYDAFEQMVDTCTYCGFKKGFGFRVWTKPKPEWYLKMEKRWRGAQ